MMASALFRQAQTSYRRGDMADAGTLCQEVLSLQPTHFGALHLLGIIASRTGQMGEAIALLGRAIGARPGSAEAYHSLGNVLAQLGRPEQALLSYARAITLKPDFAEANASHSHMLEEVRRSNEVVVSTTAAMPCCCPGMATSAISARWRIRDHSRLGNPAGFRCEDPAIDDRAVDGSVFEC